MEWTFTEDRPIYAQLVEQLEGALATGTFAAGQKLPGVREMAAEAGVNPNTMQRALAALEESGLLHSQRTSGRFVTDDTAALAALRTALAQGLAGQYLQKMQALGFTKEEILHYIETGKEGT